MKCQRLNAPADGLTGFLPIPPTGGYDDIVSLFVSTETTLFCMHVFGSSITRSPCHRIEQSLIFLPSGPSHCRVIGKNKFHNSDDRDTPNITIATLKLEQQRVPGLFTDRHRIAYSPFHHSWKLRKGLGTAHSQSRSIHRRLAYYSPVTILLMSYNHELTTPRGAKSAKYSKGNPDDMSCTA